MNTQHKSYFNLESGILLLGPFKGEHLNYVPLEYLKVLLETATLTSHERRTLGAVIQFKEHRIEQKKNRPNRRKKK